MIGTSEFLTLALRILVAADTTFYGSQGQALRSSSNPVTDPPTNLKVFRDEITRQLICEAQRLFPNTIQFHFNSSVQAVDTEKQTVNISGNSSQQVCTCSEPVLSNPWPTHICLNTYLASCRFYSYLSYLESWHAHCLLQYLLVLQPASTILLCTCVCGLLGVQVHYDLLVAADGAGSVVRAQLAKAMPEGFVRRIRHHVVYSTVGVTPPAGQVSGHAFFQAHQFEVRQSP